MATIKLTVKSNFSEAAKDIKGIGTLTEQEAKRIEKFTKSFSGKQIDSFIQKNQRAAAAVKATRGPLEAAKTAQMGLRREIEKLIRNGMDPGSASLQKLQKEYKKTTRQVEVNTRAQEFNEKAVRRASMALVAMAAVAAASAVAIVKNAFDVASAGDKYAKISRTIGITAEELQELQFVADRSGVSNEKLNTALQKLNKNVGDVRAGTGALTTLLKAQNPQLLEQLKNVENNDDAFSLLTGEIGNMSNAADRAALAQAAFGRTGQDLINVALLGADGIKDLREEARSYGLISDDAAEASEKFIDAQTNALAAVQGLRNEMAVKLLPAITSVMEGFTAFITDGERLGEFCNWVIPILGGLTAGFLSFLIITKVIAIIKGFSTAMAVLNAVIAANPVILIAAAIAVVVVAIIVLMRNWDKVVVFMQETIAKIQTRFEQFGAAIKSVWTQAINGIKIVFLELAGVIFDKIMPAINKFLDMAGKLPFVGEKFQNLQGNVNNLAAELEIARVAAIDQSRAAVQAAKDEKTAANEKANSTIAAIRRESEARKAGLNEQEAELEAFNESLANPPTAPEAGGGGGDDPIIKALSDRLLVLNNMEAVANQERLTTYGDFLSARMDQENIDLEGRILFLESEKERILALDTLTGIERISAEQAIADEILKTEQELSKAKADLLKKDLGLYANFFGALSDLASTAGEENKALFYVTQALASAEALVNSYLAFTQVLADPSFIGRPWMRAIAGGTVLASGLAAQARIVGTVVNAESGGNFTVPENPSSSRGDSQTMKVNPGEEVNVSARGESGKKSLTVNNYFDKQLLWSATQEGIDAGEINFSNDNVRSA